MALIQVFDTCSIWLANDENFELKCNDYQINSPEKLFCYILQVRTINISSANDSVQETSLHEQ